MEINFPHFNYGLLLSIQEEDNSMHVSSCLIKNKTASCMRAVVNSQTRQPMNITVMFPDYTHTRRQPQIVISLMTRLLFSSSVIYSITLACAFHIESNVDVMFYIYRLLLSGEQQDARGASLP